MNDKTGKPYEVLTQVIFQAILGQKEFPNLKVERDVILQGKAQPHQIDVYWKFEFGGVSHEVIVQTKDWQKPVDLSHLMLFTQVLDDLPGQPKGIFVTRTGYQSGAKDWADKYGITLYELREDDCLEPPLSITAGGWARVALIPMPLAGLVSTEDSSIDPATAVSLGFDFESFTPRYTQIAYETPKNWLQNEYPSANIDPLAKINFSPLLPHKTLHFDDAGAEVGNLGSVTDKILEGMRKDQIDKTQARHVFDPPVFIQTGDPVIPRVKVMAVSVSVEITRTKAVRRLRMSNFTQLVMHQLNSDKRWWFATTPTVISKLSKKGKPRDRRK